MNKQALTEALAVWDIDYRSKSEGSLNTVLAAARLVERLLPGECETCAGEGVAPVRLWPARVPVDCPDCHGSGQVWDEGIVEAVAKAMNPWLVGSNISRFGQEAMARAVLSAIAQLAEAGSQ